MCPSVSESVRVSKTLSQTISQKPMKGISPILVTDVGYLSS